MEYKDRCFSPLLSGALAICLFALAGCEETVPQLPAPTTQLMAIETPPPAYPPELACNDIGGKVLLQLAVGPDGRTESVRMLESSGQPALDAAAREAVQLWRFEPATTAGQPIASRLNVPMTFTPPPIKPDNCLVLQDQQRRATQAE